MTTHVVADDALGVVARRQWEVQRRVMEGTLDPGFVAKNLQLIAEERPVSSAAATVTACPFFAGEEVKSNYGYPSGYAVKPITEQLIVLSKHFPGLDVSSVLGLSKDLPGLPQGAEGWFVVPKHEKVATTYNDAVEKILEVIGATRNLYNYRKGVTGPKYLKLSDRTAEALRMIGDYQKGDVLLIPGQFGLMHRGCSTRRTRMVYAPNEFGLGSFIGGTMLLTHPERLVQWEQLHVDLPGDEYSSGADGQFGHAPCLYFLVGRVKFGADGVSCAYGLFGSASGFLPQ